MIGLASEHAASGINWSLILEAGVILSTLILTLATIGLWYATAQVHKDEIIKMTGALSHDNDNMTEVAMAEIQAHHNPEMQNRMRQLKHKR